MLTQTDSYVKVLGVKRPSKVVSSKPSEGFLIFTRNKTSVCPWTKTHAEVEDDSQTFIYIKHIYFKNAN